MTDIDPPPYWPTSPESPRSEPDEEKIRKRVKLEEKRKIINKAQREKRKQKAKEQAYIDYQDTLRDLRKAREEYTDSQAAFTRDQISKLGELIVNQENLVSTINCVKNKLADHRKEMRTLEEKLKSLQQTEADLELEIINNEIMLADNYPKSLEENKQEFEAQRRLRKKQRDLQWLAKIEEFKEKNTPVVEQVIDMINLIWDHPKITRLKSCFKFESQCCSLSYVGVTLEGRIQSEEFNILKSKPSKCPSIYKNNHFY